jgi:hypothetical protein
MGKKTQRRDAMIRNLCFIASLLLLGMEERLFAGCFQVQIQAYFIADHGTTGFEDGSPG